MKTLTLATLFALSLSGAAFAGEGTGTGNDSVSPISALLCTLTGKCTADTNGEGTGTGN